MHFLMLWDFCQSVGTPSPKILRIEISGPKQPQLTIVDLPGLIHSHNKHQTEHDVELVTNLVVKYMANPKSIILAVVSAKNDFPNQIILKRAREVDPQAMRTLGVITKPDQLVTGSDGEKIFLSLARNEQVEFHLGWHVVRNLDSSDEDQDRDSAVDARVPYNKSSSRGLPYQSESISS